MCFKFNALSMILAAGLGLLGQPARAEPAAESPAWIPSISLGLGLQVQNMEGALDSTMPGLGPPTTYLPIPRGPVEDEHQLFMPLIPLGLQLKGPALEALPGAPRPFFHASALFAPDSQRSIVREGGPDAVIFSETPQAPEGIVGQGSEVTADFAFEWSAGIGLAFPFALENRTLELKLSADYFGQVVDLEGIVINVRRTDPDTECSAFYTPGDPKAVPPDPGTPGPCPVDSVESSETTIQHGIGLRTGLETDAGHWGPVYLSIFLDASLYYMLGDLSTSFGATTPNGSASFAFDSDPLVFQAGAGLRFNWKGF
jgi:hypothetical protein